MNGNNLIRIQVSPEVHLIIIKSTFTRCLHWHHSPTKTMKFGQCTSTHVHTHTRMHTRTHYTHTHTTHKHTHYTYNTHTTLHARTHAHAHTQTTHTHKLHTHKLRTHTKSLAAAKRSRRPSGMLGCLGTTQVLWASAGKSTRGRASTPQVGLYHAQGDGVSTRSPNWTTPISHTHAHTHTIGNF